MMMSRRTRGHLLVTGRMWSALKVARMRTCGRTTFRHLPTSSANTDQDGLKHLALQVQQVARDLTSMKEVLASGLPIVIGFSVYQSFESDRVTETGIVPMLAITSNRSAAIASCWWATMTPSRFIVGSRGSGAGQDGQHQPAAQRPGQPEQPEQRPAPGGHARGRAAHGRAAHGRAAHGRAAHGSIAAIRGVLTDDSRFPSSRRMTRPPPPAQPPR